MLRIYLARHGETAWNHEGRLQGSTDIPLNERGEAQALELVSRLAHASLSHIYVSALRRSQQTARHFHPRIERTVLPELNERRMGRFEGQRITDLPQEVLARFRQRRFELDDELDGGESLRMHLTRVRRALETIRARHEQGDVLVVGHGATNALMLTDLYGREPHQVVDLRIGNAAVFVIELAADAPVCIRELSR